MRWLLLAVLASLLVGCQPRRPGPRELRVTVLETGRVTSTQRTPAETPTPE